MQPLNLLTAHLFAHVAKLDEGHTSAPDLEDWDWLRVDEELTELGLVTLTTTHAPTARLEVTSQETQPRVWLLATGGRGLLSTQTGSIVTSLRRLGDRANSSEPRAIRLHLLAGPRRSS